jgi:hypothetical protein
MAALYLGRLGLTLFGEVKSDKVVLCFNVPVARGQHKAIFYIVDGLHWIGCTLHICLVLVIT